MNLLSNLWKPATDIKPEELIGKVCKTNEGYPVIVLKVYKTYAEVTKDGVSAWPKKFNELLFLDESPEAVKEAMKPLYRKIKDYVISLDTPDNAVYQENSLLIQSCFAKALELIEEFESI